jgi:hypothetical protein
MPLYPESVARCQHIKVNGTQCASPALRRQKYCYFHKQHRQKRLEINSNIQRERWKITLPVLEDANSIQMGLVQVMRLLVTQQIDHRTAALMLYGLQTASSNLKRTSFEPEQPTHVVIDRDSVAHRPLGVTAWSKVKGQEYDDATEWTGRDEDQPSPDDDRYDSMFAFLIDRFLSINPRLAAATLGEMKELQHSWPREG